MINAAVLDWNLHGESGISLAEALRAREIVFVITTGYGSVEERFADHSIVGKPYVPQVLLEHLGELLAK